MRLPDDYKKNIETMFGEIGIQWLKTIPDKIEKYVDKFNLKNVELLKNLTYNVLLFAESDEYGPVVLKIEIPFKEMTIRESQALKLNGGRGACQCYYNNIDDGVLLIEKLIPGKTLSSISELDKRIKIFNDVSSKFNIQINEKVDLPTYKEILERSIKLCEEQSDKFNCVSEFLNLAIIIYDEMHKNNDSNYLLHSDLYCDNILESNGKWKAIDPHGFIGEKVLDSAIFMQKELYKKDFDINDIQKLTKLMSENTAFEEKELLRALFINSVLNICWDIEVNLDMKDILKNIDKVKILLDNLDEKGLIPPVKRLKY